jgi:hypothetical protein
LQAYTDPADVLDEVVAAAVALIPGTDEGSISVITGRRYMTSQSPSGELPQRIDVLQVEVGEGPCLDAVFQQQTVRMADMANEQRWPKFARRAAKTGARSMLSFQLYVEGDNLGALNLYSSRPMLSMTNPNTLGCSLLAMPPWPSPMPKRFNGSIERWIVAT